ncbi:MAG: HAD-IA family hydrolase [Mariprofundaceae bacterium]|nr:HAD-IA family hydrolase [Mariprofundaceae bacterium]
MTHLILFDCDGTLTDSNMVIVRAMQRAFEDHNLSIPRRDDVLALLGMSLNAVVEGLMPRKNHKLQSDLALLVSDIGQAYRQHYRVLEKDVCLYPGVLEVLQRLKERGYWMAIVTGKSHAGLLRVIERFELKQYFFAWRTADCCHSKPHPAMALECMAVLGAEALKTTLVGDSHFDIQMAKAAGVRALGVSFGSESAQILYDEGADKVLGKFVDLLDCFPQLS